MTPELRQLHDRLDRAERRARLSAALACVAVGLTLLLNVRPAALAQTPGVSLAGLLARIGALEYKTAAFTRADTAPSADEPQGGIEITLTGANLHIVNGLGLTDGDPADPYDDNTNDFAANGLGNLILGYNERRADNPGPGAPGTPDVRTGSHTLVIGNEDNYAGVGGMVVGQANAASSNFASVTGGTGNAASGPYASVSGGANSVASGNAASVTGGSHNTAAGYTAAITGGAYNGASVEYTSVTGGFDSTASASYAAVTGGYKNAASGFAAVAAGGINNAASGPYAAVTAGTGNTASNFYAAVSGGGGNVASGSYACVSGGQGQTVSSAYGYAPGATPSQLTTLTGLQGSVSGLQSSLTTLTANSPFTVTGTAGQPGALVTLSGFNLQVVNGLGGTRSVNGLGNLIVGYNEMRGGGQDVRTGSHNIVTGVLNNYTGDGGLLGGYGNTLGGFEPCILGGVLGTTPAGANQPAILGGYSNSVLGDYATVAGGANNTAKGNSASVSGGTGRSASAAYGWSAGSQAPGGFTPGNFSSP